MVDVLGDLLRYSFIFMCLFLYTNFVLTKLSSMFVDAINRYVGLRAYLGTLSLTETEDVLKNGQTRRTQEN